MEHPKILFIHHGKGIGGAPLSLLYLVEGLLKTTYKPLVVFLHDSDAMTLFKKKNIRKKKYYQSFKISRESKLCRLDC